MIRLRASRYVAAMLLASCSGQQTLPSAPTAPSGTAAVTFVVVVPTRTAALRRLTRRPQFISPSTQSVVVALGGKTLLTMDVNASSHVCADTSGSRRCAGRVSAPSGSQTFDVTAYDGAHGTGNVLATASVHASLTTGSAQRIGLSLTGTPATLSLALSQPYPPAGKPATSAIDVSALDADGNTILGAYGAPIALTDSDSSGATKLTATTIDASSAHATLSYNGHALGVAQITAKASGVPIASAAFAPSPTNVAQYTAPWLKLSPTKILPIGVSDICIGPDGNVWATGASSGAIEKITADGTFTTYPLLGTEPLGISVGADGNLWFAEDQAGKIGRITTTGSITSYKIPTAPGGSSQPTWTTRGPDGRTWYVDNGINVAGAGAVTAGGKVTTYALPAGSGPQEIVTGPDGNLWITDGGLNAIVVLSTSGKVVAVHRLLTTNAAPWGIAVGPDKNVWFAEFGVNNVGRIDVATGKVSEYPVPTAFAGPLNVAAGPDGNVWFTETGGGFWDFAGRVGYITTDGKTIRDFAAGSVSAHVHDLAFDSKGNLWFTKFAFTYSALDKLVY